MKQFTMLLLIGAMTLISSCNNRDKMGRQMGKALVDAGVAGKVFKDCSGESGGSPVANMACFGMGAAAGAAASEHVNMSQAIIANIKPGDPGWIKAHLDIQLDPALVLHGEPFDQYEKLGYYHNLELNHIISEYNGDANKFWAKIKVNDPVAVTKVYAAVGINSSLPIYHPQWEDIINQAVVAETPEQLVTIMGFSDAFKTKAIKAWSDYLLMCDAKKPHSEIYAYLNSLVLPYKGKVLNSDEKLFVGACIPLKYSHKFWNDQQLKTTAYEKHESIYGILGTLCYAPILQKSATKLDADMGG